MNFKINSRPIFTIISKLTNDNFKTRDFSPLIERVLAGVRGLTLPIEKIITLKTLIFSITMGANYSFYVKTIETHGRAFLTLNISAIGKVTNIGSRVIIGLHKTYLGDLQCQNSHHYPISGRSLLPIAWVELFQKVQKTSLFYQST